MAVIVITGSTRGIGLGLARAFLARGHKVMVSSRGQAAVDITVRELAPLGEVGGQACDVSAPAAVEALWDAAIARFGAVDIWISNAGASGPRLNVADMPPGDVASVFATNLTGTVNCMRVAIPRMERQGHGKIFNFEGFGSTGMTAPGMSIYGASKRAITYLTKSANKELKGSPVILGTISPGIVVTDLLDDMKDADPAQWEKTKRLYDVLADPVEVVAPWIADRVLAADKPGAAITWLTTGKAAWRFMTARLTGQRVMPD